MKNLKEITTAIVNMADETFEKIDNAEMVYFFGKTAKERKNAYNKMVYNLKKHNLTINEWFAWKAE